MSEQRKSIQEMTNGEPTPEKRDRRSWVAFVESDVVNFLQLNDLEKVTLDDGAGNKAKLTRRKDGSVHVECTSTNVL